MSNKLELTWYGKEKQVKIEPRLLIEDASFSNTTSCADTENMLIHGDNLLALKALETKYTGKVKCVYIDPPYNTGSAFEHYDDNLEHSTWLSLMRPRLELLWKLLCSDGLLAVQIDDNEFARLYLLLCEICHESNLKVICVKMSEATGVKMASVNKAGSIPKLKEYIILAKKDGIRNLKLEKVAKEKWDKEYKTYCSNISDEELEKIKIIMQDEDRTDEDLQYVDSVCKKIQFNNINDIAKNEIGKNATEDWCYNNSHRIIQFATLTGSARNLAIAKKTNFGNSLPSAFGIVTNQNKMYLIRGDFNTQTELSRCKILFADQYLTVNPGDLWQDIKTTGLDNEGGVDFKNSKKPERLIKRILALNTSPGDLVLDSFLGSGTTAAVAHKMARRWIGIEMGEHAYTHCKTRLDKVIAGTDLGGITKASGWTGGGGYKFYELSPPLIVESDGIETINPLYDDQMLARAVAMYEGYDYSPDANIFWKQSHGSENSYLFVTTKFVTAEFVNTIHNAMKSDEYLVIACKSYDAQASTVCQNITIKKLPQMLTER